MDANQIVAKLDQVLAKFGTHAYFDKGPGEIMDLSSIKKTFKPLDYKQVGKTLCQVILYRPEIGPTFVQAMLSELDDRDDFDDIIEYDPEFGDLY